MIARLELLAIAVLVLLTALGLSYFMTWRDGYRAGEAKVEQAATTAATKQRQREEAALDALTRDAAKRTKDYDTALQKIRTAQDECSRRLAPAAVVNGLR